MDIDVEVTEIPGVPSALVLVRLRSIDAGMATQALMAPANARQVARALEAAAAKAERAVVLVGTLPTPKPAGGN